MFKGTRAVPLQGTQRMQVEGIVFACLITVTEARVAKTRIAPVSLLMPPVCNHEK